MPKQSIHTILIAEISSTNERAKVLLKEKGQSFPFVVQANFQLKGKGQYTKVWESNKGENLLCSLVIEAPKIEIEKQFDISKVVAVSIQNVLSQYCKKVCIKWPNDIYIGNKKVAGILIENTIVGQKIDACIIGIGLNINQIRFSDELPNPISLKQVTSVDEDIELIRNNITSAILDNLTSLYAVHEQYDKYLYRKGELGKFVDDTNREFLGVILGVDEQGKLLLRTENNLIRSFSNNEVRFILPEVN